MAALCTSGSWDEDRLERFPNLKDLHEYVTRIDEMIEGKKELLNTLYNN